MIDAGLDGGPLEVILLNPILLNEGRSVRDAFQLGLVYLSTFLEKNNVKSTIIAGESVLREVKLYIEERGSTVSFLIGFYVTADNINDVENISSRLKNCYADRCKIIIGGPEASVSYKNILSKNKNIDFACIGSGEETLLELYHSLLHKKTCERIPNLSYVSCGRIVGPVLNRPPKNLDFFPLPDRSLYDKRYIDTSLISSSRGCASKCTFCYEGRVSNISHHSIDRVIEEMKYLYREFGTKYFVLSDDTFTTFRSRVLNFTEKFKESFALDEGFRWYCEGKVSDIDRNPDMLHQMIQAGLIRLQIGIESGNQSVLESYGKRITLEQVYNTAKYAQNYQLVSLYGNFIIGGAHETHETFIESLSLALRLIDAAPGIFECTHTFFSPYNGTDIKDDPVKYDLSIIDGNFYTGSSISKVFAVPFGMTEEEVAELGNLFSKEIEKKMITIIPSLSVSVIKRQLKAMVIDLTTKWGLLLIRDSVFSQWIKLYKMGYSDLIANDESVIPVRLFNINTLKDGEFVWSIRNKKIMFSSLELDLIKYASGKLTVGKIIQVIAEKNGVSPCGDLLVKAFNFYNQLAKEMLVLYRVDYSEYDV